MANRLDFSARDRKGRLTLLVDVKRVQGTSKDWAAQWRLFLVSEGYLETDCMHVLVVPHFIYVWPADEEPDVGPRYALDAMVHLGKSYERFRLTPLKISHAGFEDLVGIWLSDLSSKVHTLSSEASLTELRQVGLLQALEGADVEHDALDEAV
jgi:hypothetical protein